MKNTFGNALSVTLFGESHGDMIGLVMDGLAPGMTVDLDFIRHKLSLRRPAGDIATGRREEDEFSIVSGVYNGKTTGTPLCILIPNRDVKSKDYSKNEDLLRPSHADYTAQMKYHGFQDKRGGGHFSGRLTAALVAGGAILLSALAQKGIYIGTHVKACGGVSDRDFSDLMCDIHTLENKTFAVLDEGVEEKMKSRILAARQEGDSVGGILETAIVGMPAGVGEPWFDSLEGVLAHAIFSIPAIKGIEFGSGFGFADLKGSQANDPFTVENGKISTLTNQNGGINGGITNGMPILFRCAVKPTPTIFKEQKTVNIKKMENTVICAEGRHDPAILHRARVVVDSVAAMALCDMLSIRFGTDFLRVDI